MGWAIYIKRVAKRKPPTVGLLHPCAFYDNNAQGDGGLCLRSHGGLCLRAPCVQNGVLLNTSAKVYKVTWFSPDMEAFLGHCAFENGLGALGAAWYFNWMLVIAGLTFCFCRFDSARGWERRSDYGGWRNRWWQASYLKTSPLRFCVNRLHWFPMVI